MAFLKSSKRAHFADCYEIICPIGAGGYSTVYKARSKNTPYQEVAVKRLDKRRKNHTIEEMTQRCQEEAKILSQSKHPNIVEYIDYYDEQDYFYLITEYLPGKDIFTQIRTEGRVFSETECRQVIKSLLITVKSLHDKNIIHRDLKLENLFYYPKTSDYSLKNCLKLIDFGFATHVQGMNLCDGVGTLYYAAPEVYKHEPYGKPVDLWSIGVIAYILMYGQYPFYSKQKNQLSKLILSGKFHLPEFNKEKQIVSTNFKDFIMRLLILNPLRRMSIDTALDHSWFKPLASFGAVAKIICLVKKWKKLSLQNKIKTPSIRKNHMMQQKEASSMSSQLSERFASSTVCIPERDQIPPHQKQISEVIQQPTQLIQRKNFTTSSEINQPNLIDKVTIGLGKLFRGVLLMRY